MQLRRLFVDDHRGVDEALSEPGATGNGVSSIATYYLQFHSISDEQSF